FDGWSGPALFIGRLIWDVLSHRRHWRGLWPQIAFERRALLDALPLLTADGTHLHRAGETAFPGGDRHVRLRMRPQPLAVHSDPPLPRTACQVAFIHRAPRNSRRRT